MIMESVKGTGMSYQGGQTTVELNAASKIRTESVPVENMAGTVRPEATGKKQAGAFTSDDRTEGVEQQTTQNSQIKKAVEDINKGFGNSEAIFGIHDATNPVTIKIVDKESKKVLKEYPAEKTLDMIAKAWEMAGIMVDEKR